MADKLIQTRISDDAASILDKVARRRRASVYALAREYLLLGILHDGRSTPREAEAVRAILLGDTE